MNCYLYDLIYPIECKKIKCSRKLMGQDKRAIDIEVLIYMVKCKAIPLQAWTGPEGSRSLRFPDFKTIGTRRW
jgi:hypothetical protein